MKKYTLEDINKKISKNEYKEGDKIYCLEYPNLIFIFENNEFIGYYQDGHDLFSDGQLSDFLKENKEYTISNEPFIEYPDEMN